MLSSRRRFLATVAAAAGGLVAAAAARSTPEAPVIAKRMPVLFLGHGSPMNVVLDNAWSRGWRTIAGLVPRPKAILCVSAHWTTAGIHLTKDPLPRQIHDMSGFPREVQEYVYPAKGAPDLAARVRGLIGEDRAALDGTWGIDHGTWSVLAWMYPQADVPVIQLSLDERLPPARHVELAKSLAPLRDEGVLVLGSGNAVHNLGDAMRRFRETSPSTPDWATRFDAAVARSFVEHDGPRLAGLAHSDDGKLAHPWNDHFLPLLYAMGATERDEPVAFPVEGFDGGSISMRSILVG